MIRRPLLQLIALVLLAAGVSYFLNRTRTLAYPVADSSLALRLLQDRKSPQTARGLGDLTVVMFTDYQCPACRKADPALRAAVARDGNVRLVYKDWPIFGPASVRAARVALAADRQGVYPRVHHQLMRARSFDDVALRRAVEMAGGEWERLEDDLLAYGPQLEQQLAINGRDALALGLRGTPGYLIGPLRLEGALTEREFLRVFEQARSMR